MNCAGCEKSATSFLCDPRWKVSRLGLERVSELLDRMGRPQNRLKFVHITGTNGKGSTAAMIASMLTQANLKTGLFTSPCLERINEQIQVNGREISADELEGAAAVCRQAADQMSDHPTEFEMLVATALEHFAASGCDLVVLEVGMGGLRDATNVVEQTEVAILTTISLDHTAILGSTTAEIAAEKAGIIKPGCTAVSVGQDPQVERVLREICAEKNVPLIFCDERELFDTPSLSQDGLHFSYRGMPIRLPLLGWYQLQNAAAAVTAVAQLNRRGWKIPDEAVRRGLERVSWPGRLELLCRQPFFLLDGAHNPQGAQTVADTLNRVAPGERFTFLVGILADKDWKGTLSPVFPMAERFLITTPPNPRAMPGEELAGNLRDLGFEAQVFASPEEGARQALKLAGPEGRICAFGSLYQAGMIRRTILKDSRL
ncbi:MAG: bifunctional folylpolyglutamate synthase/dihydrofolate synthase [Oscillospiraceae bacterium]|nr:MAG: bifunctional folylpolyglutamate synthase/dihydrofolate synthase [Oscillospiraceae bacterium]